MKLSGAVHVRTRVLSIRAVLAPALLALATCAALGACRSEPARPEPLPPDEAARLLVDRNWLDRHPESDQKRFHVLRLVPAFNMSGVYQNRTLYQGDFELFFFKHSGDTLSFDLPHTHTKMSTGYHIERLRPGEHPPFDLRLRLEKSPRGPRVYYGLSSERAASLAPEAGALLGKLLGRRR